MPEVRVVMARVDGRVIIYLECPECNFTTRSKPKEDSHPASQRGS